MNTKNISIHTGIVTKMNNGQYWIYENGNEYRGISHLGFNSPGTNQSRTRHPVREEPSDIVVGDRVSFILPDQVRACITEVLPRFNHLARRAAKPMPDSHSREQIIAANIDQIVAVMSLCQPAPRWNLLDRYLVSAESLEIKPIICLTKADLARTAEGALGDEVDQEIAIYRRLGYTVLVSSIVSGEGIADLEKVLASRKSVLLGKSGAGKSSLINHLLPGIDLRVNAVSQITGKGRHTTTGVEMHLGSFGGWLVDTPGTREFGLWGVDSDDLAWFFPEMRAWLGKCRFGLNCRHDEEPGCAVRNAVMAGEIHPRRYFSMMKLKQEGYFQW